MAGERVNSDKWVRTVSAAGNIGYALKHPPVAVRVVPADLRAGAAKSELKLETIIMEAGNADVEALLGMELELISDYDPQTPIDEAITFRTMLDPEAGYGNCGQIAYAFQEFLEANGVESQVLAIVDDENGFQHHCNLIVDNGTEMVVDWTYNQFASEMWGELVEVETDPITEPLESYKERIDRVAKIMYGESLSSDSYELL